MQENGCQRRCKSSDLLLDRTKLQAELLALKSDKNNDPIAKLLPRMFKLQCTYQPTLSQTDPVETSLELPPMIRVSQKSLSMERLSQLIPVGDLPLQISFPLMGSTSKLTAFDLKGNLTTKTVRLERTKRNQKVNRLAAVNPLVGPKQKPSRDRAALIIGVEKYARAPISRLCLP